MLHVFIIYMSVDTIKEIDFESVIKQTVFNTAKYSNTIARLEIFMFCVSDFSLNFLNLMHVHSYVGAYSCLYMKIPCEWINTRT